MALGKVKIDQIESSTHVVDVDDLLDAATIGVTVQGYDADLAAVAALSTTGIVNRTGSGTVTTITAPSGNLVGTSATQTLTSKTLTSPALVGTITEDTHAFGSSEGFEIDPANGSIQLLLLEGNHTAKGTNFQNGKKVQLFVDDGFGQFPYTVDWTDSTFGFGGVEWLGGAIPLLSTSGYTCIELTKAFGQVRGAVLGANLRQPNLEVSAGLFVNGRYTSKNVSSGSIIDCSQGNSFTFFTFNNTTFSFTNTGPSGNSSISYSFTLRVTHQGGTLTWPFNVKWPGGTAPVLTTFRDHLFMFTTLDSGMNWYGAALVDYS